MKGFAKYCYTILQAFGFNPRTTYHAIKGIPVYFRNRKLIKQQSRLSHVSFLFGKPFPCLHDRFAQSGVAQGHYFHQDLRVAQQVFKNKPIKHVDVGSRIDGFVAHVAAYRPIEVIDIRPLNTKIDNMQFIQLDFMRSLPSIYHEYTDSISCLHALEHFGLGRYGDPIDFEGHIKGLNNLTTMLKPGGTLYLSVPIGNQRIEFDAHRVFSINTVLELTKDHYTLLTFSYIDDLGNFHKNMTLTEDKINNNFFCQYGCGVFTLKKKNVS